VNRLHLAIIPFQRFFKPKEIPLQNIEVYIPMAPDDKDTIAISG